MSKEAILKNILSAAEASAQNILAEAKADAAEITERARQEANIRLADAKKQAEQNAALNRTRKAKIAQLDAKKLSLAARRRLISRVYAMAAQRLVSMPDADYRAFVGRLVNKYAEQGDVVAVSPRDVKRLDDKWLAEVAPGKQLTLTIGETDFMGGVLIRNAVCDKNLSVEMLVEEVRAYTETQVAAMTEE